MAPNFAYLTNTCPSHETAWQSWEPGNSEDSGKEASSCVSTIRHPVGFHQYCIDADYVLWNVSILWEEMIYFINPLDMMWCCELNLYVSQFLLNTVLEHTCVFKVFLLKFAGTYYPVIFIRNNMTVLKFCTSFTLSTSGNIIYSLHAYLNTTW